MSQYKWITANHNYPVFTVGQYVQGPGDTLSGRPHCSAGALPSLPTKLRDSCSRGALSE